MYMYMYTYMYTVYDSVHVQNVMSIRIYVHVYNVLSGHLVCVCTCVCVCVCVCVCIHLCSIVFGGFSAESLRSRIEDGKLH